ncbi:MAG: hypothetical protein HUJ51_05880 [Eggerthellaceae bacterium]|nr:hypothetical protein [Eggerthellaceae bacterium]
MAIQIFGGAFYIQNCNKADFSYPVIMIYGYFVPNDYMFSTLHRFRDKAVSMRINTCTYLYANKKNYKLLTISAYERGDKYVISNRNFLDENVCQSYFDYVPAPEFNSVNVREGVKPTPRVGL